MSNACCTSVTSVIGSRPASVSAAKSSNSLPKPHEPTFLPARSSTESMPASANDTCRVPERWKICATSVIIAPCSRLASAFGTHAIAKSAAPSASTVCGTMSAPPSVMVTSRPAAS